MDGDVTQTRSLPGQPSYTSTYVFGSRTRGPTLIGLGGSQTTTSYRTGRRADRFADSSLENVVDSAGTTDASLTQALSTHANDYPPTADRGHEFTTEKRVQSYSHPQVRLVGQGPLFGSVWEGPLVPIVDPDPQTGSQWLNPPPINTAYYGPAAIHATIPTRSAAGLAVALAELQREGFPHSEFSASLAQRSSVARDAGEDYLNHQFGWMPLIGDVTRAAVAVKNASRILKQFADEAGKPQRRRLDFPPIVTEDVVQHPDGSRLFLPDTSEFTAAQYFVGGIRNGQLTEYRNTYQRYSFSGAYVYHLAGDDSSLVDRLIGFGERADKLLGFRITPEVLWNLAPWSWLSDWNWNIGMNISNATALGQDGLVLKYGYLMRETIVDRVITLTGPTGNPSTSGPFSVTYSTVRKERVRSTPYGFGLNPASFSLKQWSILGALGLTKAPKVLW